MASATRIAVAALVAMTAGASGAQAQSALRLHESIAAPQRPLLCADRDSVNLVLPVLSKAADARATREADKSQRLTEIATRLQGEVCRKSAADDVVILRCKLGQVEAGGSALALVKMSALIQTEAAKGEQAFYGWTDLKIEDVPGLQESNARWCASERPERTTRQIRVEERDASGGGATPPAREPEEPFTPTQDIVLRIQQRLFDFGYRIENLDGQLNHETVQSIQQFQKMANLNPDGQLTRSTVIKMMTMPAPSPWVAIAFDGFGNYIAEIARTRRNAEFVALEQLQRRWSSKDPRVVSVSAPQCLGLALTRYVERGRRGRTNFTQAFTSAGDAMDSAAQNALDYCERAKNGGECQIRYALCADGTGGNRAPEANDGERRRNRNDRQEDANRHDRRAPPINQEPRFDRKNPPVGTPSSQGPRFDDQDLSINSRGQRPGQAPKFDPNSLPPNTPPSQGQPPVPSLRFDSEDPAANSRRTR
jgi:hypothetical protein